MRLMRSLLGGVVTLAVLAGALAYGVYAANGILDRVEAEDQRDRRDKVLIDTATAIAQRLTQAAVSPTVEPPTRTPLPSPTPLPTDTLVPTELPATPTDVPTDTPEAPVMMQAANTDTPTVEPSSTPTTAPSATIAPLPTNTVRPTSPPPPSPLPTNTARPSVTPLPTDTLTPSVTPSFTASPTYTASPTLPPPTPTFTATIPPTATYVIQGTYALPVYTPVVEIPERVPLLDTDPDVVNFLLLGSDTTGGGVGHTDVMILVSVNKRAQSVAMWHLPRDLFVYIPNHTMERINLAYALGEQSGYPGGGFGLMKETILYNLGIEIDHYARVDFDDFMRIVEELGGLEISVDCAISDWRLVSPELDPLVEDNWEYYTLPIGRQELTPYMALWYVRSRKTTSDLDRGRRQMDALRAMWVQARKQGLFAQVTALWPQAVQVVETDMSLTDVLGLVPLAVSLDMSNIARYSGTDGVHYIPFVTPDDKREVFLPNRDALIPLIQDFLTPPTENRLDRKAVTVDVIDASAYGLSFDQVAVDRLAWEGFAARPVTVALDRPLDLSMITDFTGQSKSTALDDLKRVLRISDAQVISQPDPNRTVDFRVEIGAAYNACVYGGSEDEIEAGPPIPTPTPGEAAPGSFG